MARGLTNTEKEGRMSTYKYPITRVTYAFNRRSMKKKAFADTPYTFLADDEYVELDPTNGNVTGVLPAIGGNPKGYYVKCMSASNAVTLTPTGADTIDGLTSFTLTANNDFVLLAGDPVKKDWKVVSTSVAPS
jgi:hypothetical protein